MGTHPIFESDFDCLTEKMIRWKEHYIEGAQLKLEEDRLVEFKNHKSISCEEVPRDSIGVQPISNTICGFLNQGRGGQVLLGVHDSGRVVGLKLTLAQMEHLKGSITDTICRFNPKVNPSLVEIKFVPVITSPTASWRDELQQWFRKERAQLDNETGGDLEAEEKKHRRRKPIGSCWCEHRARMMSENREKLAKWIVRLRIGTPPGLKSRFGAHDAANNVSCTLQYVNEERVSYLRIDGGTRRMGPFDASRHVNETVRAHYRPILERLRNELDEHMRLIDGKDQTSGLIKREEENLGMRKRVGDVIQPNIQKPLN